MTYIGSKPATSFVGLSSQSFTGGSGTSFTLNKSVSSTSDIAVFVNNVRQNPTNASYSVSGTTLTMSASIASSDIFYVVFLGATTGTVNPQAGSVGTSQLIDTGVTGAKLNADIISSQTALGVAPADTDEFLVSDAGVLKRIDYSLLKSEGGLVHLNGTTASGATSVDFTESGGVIDFTKFRRYYVRIAGVGNHGSTGASTLQVRVYVNNSVATGNAYRYANLRHRYSPSSTSGSGAGDTKIPLFVSNYYNNTGQNMSGDFTIDFSPYYVPMWAFGQSYGNTAFTAIQTSITSGAYYGHTSSQDVDGISFFMSTGTVTGRFDIYGFTNSAGGTDLGA